MYIIYYFYLMSFAYFFEDFVDDQAISLSESNTHHMVNVLRMKNGDQCWITNGKGTRVHVRLTAVSKRHCEIECVETILEAHPPSSLHLAISFTKNSSRIEWLLEKATEIGIGQITPLVTHRSEKHFIKKERFEKILISAMLQSQQTYLPHLHEAQSFEEVLMDDAEQKYIAWCEPHNEKVHLGSLLQKDKKTLILIGPEGDFTAEEVALSFQHGFKPVSLGHTRLRTETAGMYAVVVYNSSL